MPDATYNQVISEIKTLKLSDQLRLLEEMAALIRKKSSETKPRSSATLSAPPETATTTGTRCQVLAGQASDSLSSN